MSKDRRVRQRRGKADIRRIGAAVVAVMLVVAMVIGLVPSSTKQVFAADKTTNLEGFSAVFVADPDTSEDDHIFNGTPAEDGKIWTDKSVTTGAIYGVTAGEENFTIALSALAQTYNSVETGLTAEQKNVAYDVVFILDFSGSMNDSIGGTRKAASMVNALNPAISTLMENDNSRIAIVGYSGSSVDTSNATTLLELDHYNTTNKNSDDENIYIEYTSSGNNRVIRTVSGVTDSSNSSVSFSKTVTGGTPTQRGIYRAMDLLENTAKPNDDVTRIPIIVLLTDGAAGSASRNYTTLSGDYVYGDANSNGSAQNDDEVGAYTVLTANYAKDTVDALYKTRYDYTGILANGASAAKFYTIGLGITENSWTHFMLDPSNSSATGSTVTNMKSTLSSDSTYGTDYQYADDYWGGENMTEADLKKAFEDIVEALQVTPQVTTSVNDPISIESGDDAVGNITFVDYLGYKMELKGTSQYLRYGGVNYRFDETSDGVYAFSGYNQAGNAVTGPVITKNGTTYTLANVTFKVEWEADATYNGQTGYWKVSWEFPSALLPTYSRINDYDNTDLDPIRMLYQVGLADDVNLQKDGLKIDANGELVAADATEFAQYAFYSNLYDFATKTAMTTASFMPAANNPYYYETGYTTVAPDSQDAAKYVRVDMIANSAQLERLEANVNVTLENIELNLDNGRATFEYNGTTYTVDLSGDLDDGAEWVGEVSIPVSGQTADGQTITVNVAARIVAEYVDNWFFIDDELELTGVTIAGETATISGTSASVNNLTITVWGDVSDVTEEEIVSVYMELKQDATTGAYYVEDANGNKIDVTYNSETKLYELTLGGQKYYSGTYYEYPEGAVSYVEKNLGKGTVAKSLVGNFQITQPTSPDFELTEETMAEVFKYIASNGSEYSPYRVMLQNGDVLGEPEDPNYEIETVDGTINVCIDGIKNGQTNALGEDMIVHFDFIIEEQILSDGTSRYVVLDCYYWEEGDTYAVDVIASETPDINGNTYSYDVSYTIESTHESRTGNVTQTDEHFVDSDFTSGTITVRLGNNGRITVDLEDAYDKSVTVKKEWRDRLGNVIDINDSLLANVSITVGLYQKYSYVNTDEETITSDTNGIPFATEELNQANGFTYTWEAKRLPEYLVDAGGDYVLDKNSQKVPVTYTVDEITGPDGWDLSDVVISSTDTADTITLTNVPLTEFSPSVVKQWVNGVPAGYKVMIELLANGQPITNITKLDVEHVVEATLKQESIDGDAELSVTFGGVTIGTPQTVSAEGVYTFNYTGVDGNGFGGEAGSGTHAESVDIKITVTKTSGAKYSATTATVVYNYKDIATGEDAQAELNTFRSNVVETETTKVTTFLMSYAVENTESVSVILDGTETTPWTDTLEEWNLPQLTKNEDGSYTAIVYSIRETLLVPDENGTMTIGEDKYQPYIPDENGIIQIPQSDGSVKIMKSTITHTSNYQFTIVNDDSVTSVTAEKVWEDNNNAYGTRPDSITFELWADGVKQDLDKVITPEGDTAAIWNGTADAAWDNLPLYNVSTGAEVVYEVKEKEIETTGDKYKTTIVEESENHFVVTNSLYADPAINATSMNVEKVWIDDNNAQNTRPANLYMVLYRKLDGSTAEPELVAGAPIITLNAGNNWTNSEGWTGLAKYNEYGVKYIYSVKEFESLTARNVDGVAGYTASVEIIGENEKYKFTNKLDDGAVSKTVTKVWNDKALDANSRPNVTVVLSATTTDGNSVDLTAYAPTQILSESNSWSYEWANLPVYSNGMKIDYTIAETKVGDTVVADGVADVAGVAYDYIVSIQDDGTGNAFTVTNTVTGTTTVTVEKQWINTPEELKETAIFDVYNRYEGKVDATLTVQKGQTTASVTLPKYHADGSEIYYILEERVIVPNDTTYKFESEIKENTGTNGDFYYVAENTYVSLVQDVTGTKTWVGVKGDNIPYAIAIELYRKVGDGTPVLVTGVTPVWVKNGETWTYTYVNLPKYEDNDSSKPYTYSVKETGIQKTSTSTVETVTYSTTDETKGTVGDYSVELDGLNIKNTLGGTVDGATLDGTKTWDKVTEANVPDSIEVELWRTITGGTPEKALAQAITVTKAGQSNVMSWTYDFTGNTFDKYDANGNLYQYFVKETKVTAGSAYEEVVYDATDATKGTVGDYTVELNGLNIKNTLKEGNNKDYTVELPFTKLWKKADGSVLTTNLPASITVQLLQDDVAMSGTEYVKILTADDAVPTNAGKWTGKFENLRKYTDNGITQYKYTVTETKIGAENVISMKAGDFEVSINTAGNEITNQLSANVAKKSITVTKTWSGVTGNNIPSIELTLQKDGQDYRVVTLTATTGGVNVSGNTWTYTFSDLPIYQDNGVIECVYVVKESKIGSTTVVNGVAGDYTSQVTPGQNNTVSITNTLGGTVTEISGKKIWKDVAKENERPTSIIVELWRKSGNNAAEQVMGSDNKPVTTTATAANNWEFTFNAGYAKYDADGNAYTYSVKEAGVENGFVTLAGNKYKVEYAEDSYDITNTLYGEYDSIKVTKNWLDDNNSQGKRPASLSVSLKLAGVVKETISLTASDAVAGNSNQWVKTFANKYQMYDADGKLLEYTVEEVVPNDYSLSGTVTGNAADGFAMTNVYTQGETTIVVTKVWVDNNNALNTRPNELKLNLIRNDGQVKEVTLTAPTWTTQVKVSSGDAEGKLYTYTVQEPDAILVGTDYKKSVDDYTVTNTLTGTVQIQGIKNWKDIAEEYRPTSVTVELWRAAGNETPVSMNMSITTDASKQWKYDFGTLDKYDDKGALYTYYVKETKVGDTPIEGSEYQVTNGEGYDLINAIKDNLVVTVKGTKTWVDNDNQYKMRPESITVNLLRDGVKVDSVVVKEAEDGTWTYEFIDLPKYDMSTGKLYTYTVEEEAVENYNVVINAYDITNKLDETKIPNEPSPDTGDHSMPSRYLLMTILSFAVMVVAFFERKRVK